MIEGRYFDARSTAAQPATAEFDRDRSIHLVVAQESRRVPFSAFRVSARIGDVPRRITFADGSVFETSANDAVDAALEAAGERGFARRLVRWERLWSVAIASFLAVALVSWMFLKFGIPALAEAAARAIPVSVDAAIGAEGLALLDRTMLAPTRLPRARQESLRRRLSGMSAAFDDRHDYRLEFRRGRHVGPNAFALPSGIIVVTDELVELADRDQELDAVLAHEIGHVRGRHSLRILLQNAGVAVLALTLLGDISSTSSLAAAIPVILVQAKHSRDFEREADAHAREWLRSAGLPETYLDDMLCKLSREDEDLAYLSTHPPLRERARCRAPGEARP